MLGFEFTATQTFSQLSMLVLLDSVLRVVSSDEMLELDALRHKDGGAGYGWERGGGNGTPRGIGTGTGTGRLEYISTSRTEAVNILAHKNSSQENKGIPRTRTNRSRKEGAQARRDAEDDSSAGYLCQRLGNRKRDAFHHGRPTTRISSTHIASRRVHPSVSSCVCGGREEARARV